MITPEVTEWLKEAKICGVKTVFDADQVQDIRKEMRGNEAFIVVPVSEKPGPNRGDSGVDQRIEELFEILIVLRAHKEANLKALYTELLNAVVAKSFEGATAKPEYRAGRMRAAVLEGYTVYGVTFAVRTRLRVN